MSSTTSPNQEGVEGLDSEVVWIFTEPSAILIMPTSLLRIVMFFLFKEAYFYAAWLPVTSRCAIRGKKDLVLPIGFQVMHQSGRVVARCVSRGINVDVLMFPARLYQGNRI